MSTRFLQNIATLGRAFILVFSQRVYQAVSFVGALIFLGIYLLIPVLVIPGNSLAFELQNTTSFGYFSLFAIAVSTGLVLSIQIFSFRQLSRKKIRTVGHGSASITASLTGGIFAASCGCGVGLFLGILGFGGGALFAAQHQTVIVSIMLGMVLLGLYLSLQRISGTCYTCRVSAS